MISLGCDIGAIATKTVILKQRDIESIDITLNEGRLSEASERSFQNVLSDCGLSLDEITHRGGTGRGVRYMSVPNSTESMISCLAKGTHWLLPSARTIINIGGLSTTIINMTGDKGKVIEYRSNRRCASGTGFFLDMAARALEMEVEDLGPAAFSATGRANINVHCAVFGESEIVTQLNEGTEPADIIAGITYAVGESAASIAKRLRVEKDIVVTGGVAKNMGVIKAIEKNLGMETAKVPLDPQIIGALGAALLAQEREAHQ